MSYQHALRWYRDFFYTLFDFSFKKTITTKMLPILYGTGIIALFTSICYFAVITFMDSWLNGLLVITVIAPIGLLFGIAIIRIFLELFTTVFTMLNALHSTLASISRLESTFAKVQIDIGIMRRRLTEMNLTMVSMDSRLLQMEAVLNEMDQIVTRIPFLKTKKTDKKDEEVIKATLHESTEVASAESITTNSKTSKRNHLSG